MKIIVGSALIIFGIAFGLYAGIWWAFIGGIVEVIHEVRSDELSATATAIGIAKIIFAPLIGKLSAFVFIVPGWAMIGSS